MKKLVALFVITAAFLSFNSSTYSQPQFTIHLTGGYNLPLPDLKGDLLDSADLMNTFGMKLGYGFGADGKYYLGKKRNVGITLALGYQLFSNSEDTSQYIGRDIKTKLNAFTVGLGIEYAFMPKGKTNPFIGAEFTGHFFSGNTEFTSGSTNFSADLKSASRFGLGIGAGIDFALSKSVGIVVGGKYHLANLIGKEEPDTTAISTTEYQLVDKEYTVGTTTIEAKNISYIQFYAGVSFFLNQPKKMKK
ncbi:MAG: porin family protein [Chlorobi bacterium]|nr:porin family protein [Chlorobiota bacterium]MCI0716918.1 porin family protein [Chlorobiota bacterium]